MPDPTGANLTDSQASRIDKADPLFREFKLGDRMQELRRDFETNERNDVVSISIAGDTTTTLVAPGETAGLNEVELTSNLLFVTTTAGGADANLVLPDPGKYVGLIYVVLISKAVDLRLFHTGGTYSDMTTTQMRRALSDGTDWFSMHLAENIAKME